MQRKKTPFTKGEVYPFATSSILNLVKTPISLAAGTKGSLRLCKFCLATIGVGVFRCADFGWRTFYFNENIGCGYLSMIIFFGGIYDSDVFRTFGFS